MSESRDGPIAEPRRGPEFGRILNKEGYGYRALHQQVHRRLAGVVALGPCGLASIREPYDNYG